MIYLEVRDIRIIIPVWIGIGIGLRVVREVIREQVVPGVMQEGMVVIIMMDVVVIRNLYVVLELVRLFVWGGWGVSAFVRLRVRVPG